MTVGIRIPGWAIPIGAPKGITVNRTQSLSTGELDVAMWTPAQRRAVGRTIQCAAIKAGVRAAARMARNRSQPERPNDMTDLPPSHETAAPNVLDQDWIPEEREDGLYLVCAVDRSTVLKLCRPDRGSDIFVAGYIAGMKLRARLDP